MQLNDYMSRTSLIPASLELKLKQHRRELQLRIDKARDIQWPRESLHKARKKHETKAVSVQGRVQRKRAKWRHKAADGLPRRQLVINREVGRCLVVSRVRLEASYCLGTFSPLSERKCLGIPELFLYWIILRVKYFASRECAYHVCSVLLVFRVLFNWS